MDATLSTQFSAPTFSLATLRTVLAELSTEHPERAGRLVKAANIVAVRDITAYAGIGWLVGSECDADKSYWVQPVDGQLTCDCMDYRQRGGPCKHALAVVLLQRCERRDADANAPTAGTVLTFPTPTYTDADRSLLTPLGLATLAAQDDSRA